MKIEVRLLLLWLSFIPLGSAAQGIDDIITSLRRLDPWAADVAVEVARGDDDSAAYDLRLYASAIADTAIAPQRYLIEYSRPGEVAPGAFAALLDDRLYRYDGRRFSEYLLADSTLTPALARSPQFASLLPGFLARELADAEASTDATVTVAATGPDRVAVDVTYTADSTVYARKHILFSAPALLPISLESLSGIDTPMETILTASWTPTKARTVNRALILDRHADPMRRFAGANRCPESFLDHPLPPLILPDSRGGRYTFNPGYTTIVVLIDDEADPDLAETLTQDLRHALAGNPAAADVDFLYVILSRFTDAIRASEAPSGHEHLLLGGSALARELGATRFPLILKVDPLGLVEAVAEGVNNDPASVVIEMLEY